MKRAAERRERRERQAAVLQELRELSGDLEGAYSVFDHTADPDLVEASILEIRALQSKYGRALRQLKALMM